MRVETILRIGAFISIPKNASKTVLHVLELGENRNTENTDSPIIFENHQRGAVLNAKYDLEPLFVFCFCRNPYDRCVSWYEYHKSMAPYNTMSFGSWVRQGMPHHWVRQNQTNYAAEGISPLLQYHFIGNCKIDYVGRMENFEQDFKTIVQKLNTICEERSVSRRFSSRNELHNTSRRQSNPARYYTPEIREQVYHLLEKDFTYFGYEK